MSARLQSRSFARMVPRAWATTLASACAALALFAPALATAADDGDDGLRGNGFTIYGGTRFGGSLDDETSGKSVDIADSNTYGFTLDFQIDPQRELQLAYGRQSTDFETGALSPQTGNVPVTLQYLHVGGTYFDEELGRGWYAIGGLGITRMSPSLNGATSETRPSLHVGFGYLQPLGAYAGVRLEARGYFVALGGSSSLFCSGGCTLRLGGSGFGQGEVLLGLSVRLH
jgi:hypothetical protein